jgi:hypothetical protein
MSPGERCDAILQLIDEELGVPWESDDRPAGGADLSLDSVDIGPDSPLISPA